MSNEVCSVIPLKCNSQNSVLTFMSDAGQHYAIAAFVFCREVSSSGFEYLFVTKMWNKPLSPVLKTRRGPYHWLHAQNSGNIDKLSTRSCRDYAARCRSRNQAVTYVNMARLCPHPTPCSQSSYQRLSNR